MDPPATTRTVCGSGLKPAESLTEPKLGVALAFWAEADGPPATARAKVALAIAMAEITVFMSISPSSGQRTEAMPD